MSQDRMHSTCRLNSIVWFHPIFLISQDFQSACICERHKVTPESIWPWFPQGRTDQQACPVKSYLWNEMLWILSTFFSTFIEGLTTTYSLLNLREEQHWPCRACICSHNQNFGSLSVENCITQREGKISFHLTSCVVNTLHMK